MPAVDAGRSVSRVGGSAQLPAYRAVAGHLRLAYSQFEELERFSRYGTRIDEETRRSLEHGRRIREVFKQPENAALSAAQQIAVLVAASDGLFDDLPTARVAEAEAAIVQDVGDKLQDVVRRIDAGEQLTDEDREALRRVATEVLQDRREEDADANS